MTKGQMVTEAAQYKDEMMKWRIEDPSKFIIRIAQYLSHQYSSPTFVIKNMPR
jgi:hypothetical protein